MVKEEVVEELENAVGLIKQDGKDWLDERDIPLLEFAIEALRAEPCEDCISRQAVWDVMQELWGTSGELIDRLMALPSVTPAEKVGHWIYGEDNLGGTGRDGWYCNQCGHFEFWDYSSDMESARRNLPNFCPNCGAKMQEVGE